MRCNHLLLLAPLLFSPVAIAQGKPPASAVPEPYRQKFVRFVDNRTLKETMLNAVGLTGQDVGHSFALIAGVSQYPNMPEIYRTLPPAAADMEELQSYLVNQEMFDEVVVLKDGDMTADNLRYFMEVYFPDRLQKFPKSRFLFAYSGHGIALGSAADTRGFVLTSAAKNFTDTEHAINMATLRLYMDELSDAGYQTLALINACHSGVFIRNSFGGGNFLPREPGAHAITAGGSDQRTWSDPHLGRGSIFFEELLAGLGGQADLFPVSPDGHRGDGIITVEEIATFLREQVSLNTNQSQTPILTDLKRTGSNGGFFFLNRQRMVAKGFIPAWDPKRNTSFGADAEVQLKSAKELFNARNFTASFSLFYQAAEAGNGEAARYVGLMYDSGLGTAPDETLAVLWNRKSADAGDPMGMAILGNDYQYGRGGLQHDDASAVLWYRRSADTGSTGGMVNLGSMYGSGRGGLSKDPAQEVYWYRKAAEAGNARGMNDLGAMYVSGEGGLPKDLTQAAAWYRKAADAGDSMAMGNLGGMYDSGVGGLPKDPVLAVSWFRKAAEAGDPTAMFHLADSYVTGNGGMPKDLAKAADWERKAAEAGNERAMTNLGIMYARGVGGLPIDLTQAVYWYRKGAEAGDLNGMVNFGEMYANGLGGLPRDGKQAAFWFRKAADTGNARAIGALGLLYLNGEENFPHNLPQAAVWLRKAVDAGNTNSMAFLGGMYENGLGGLAKDPILAASLYRKSADAGESVGIAYLGWAYEVGLGGIPKDPAHAVSLYRQAADAGNGYGILQLAKAYEDGLGGLPSDPTQAALWYRKAADMGISDASDALKRLGR